jgi:hypothetical protein
MPTVRFLEMDTDLKGSGIFPHKTESEMKTPRNPYFTQTNN